MKKGWLTSACGVHVEHLPCPRPGSSVDSRKPATGVLHTIEGSLEAGLSVFRQHYAPHFAVGGGRIIQLIPLGQIAAALEHTSNPPTNGWARVQIEVAGRSSEHPYRFDAHTEQTLARLLACLHLLDVVPLRRPFPDLMPAPPWATPAFSRRLAGKWGHEPGWYGHVEVPENSHWDPGALEWTQLLNKAHQVVAAHAVRLHPKPKKLPKPKAVPKAVRRRIRPGGRAVIQTVTPR